MNRISKDFHFIATSLSVQYVQTKTKHHSYNVELQSIVSMSVQQPTKAPQY